MPSHLRSAQSRLLVAALVLVGVAAVWWLKPSSKASSRSDTEEVSPSIAVKADKRSGVAVAAESKREPHLEAGLTIIRDPVEVFSRALWRRPTSEDRVLHAERREWRDEAGHVTRWQWYLVLAPGAAVQTWLREEDPFALRPASHTAEAGSPDAADADWPAWFMPGDGSRIAWSRTQDGRFWWGVEEKTGRAYGYGEGFGFAAAVAADSAARNR